MADIFNEIDEELRADKAKQAWQRYGSFAIAGAAIIVACVAGYTYWQKSERAAQLEMADRYASALALGSTKEGALDSAQALAALTTEADGGFALLSRLQSAAMVGEAGDHSAASDAYRTIANDASVDALYRDLAVVLAVMQGAAGKGDPEALMKELELQLGDEKPWRYTARQVAAGLELARGNRSAAKDYLARISDDPNAPLGMRGSAAELLRSLGD